ncbi:MAG: hypothetical protein Q8N04_03465 [Nitrospira sp.]|nr:hypothetical protein [Nitrospira sp.]
MPTLFVLLILSILYPASSAGAQEDLGISPIQFVALSEFAAALPGDIQLLDDAIAIEGFLEALEGYPPDWPAIYGEGHHDPGHDDRLFQVNRARDDRRARNRALARRVAFRWSGELSHFDPERKGFSVALGPVLTSTRWGQVRFKSEDFPGELKAVPPADSLDRLLREMAAGKTVELAVIIIGRLIPDESIVYDFSHDQEGLGLIMPVIRVEAVHYVLSP